MQIPRGESIQMKSRHLLSIHLNFLRRRYAMRRIFNLERKLLLNEKRFVYLFNYTRKRRFTALDGNKRSKIQTRKYNQRKQTTSSYKMLFYYIIFYRDYIYQILLYRSNLFPFVNILVIYSFTRSEFSFSSYVRSIVTIRIETTGVLLIANRRTHLSFFALDYPLCLVRSISCSMEERAIRESKRIDVEKRVDRRVEKEETVATLEAHR